MKNLTRKPFVKNVTALITLKILSRIIRFVYIVLISHFLLPAAVGFYLYGLAFCLALMSLTQFGQAAFLSQRLGRNRFYRRKIINSSFTIVLLMAPAVTLPLLIFVELTENQADVRGAVMILLLSLLFRALVNWIKGAAVALKDVAWVVKYDIIFRLSEVLVGVILLYGFAVGLVGLCLLHTINWGVEALILGIIMMKRYPGFLGIGFRIGYLKKVIQVSGLFCLTAWAENLFFQLSIILIRNLGINPEILAGYTVAMQSLAVLLIVPLSLTQNLMPYLSEAYQGQWAGRLYMFSIKAIIVASTAMMVLALAYGPALLLKLFGSKYSEAEKTFTWLCPALIPYVVALFSLRSLAILNARVTAVGIWLAMIGLQAVGIICLWGKIEVYGVVAVFMLIALAGALASVLVVIKKLEIANWRPVLSALLLLLTGVFLFWHWLPEYINVPAILLWMLILCLSTRLLTLDEYYAIRKRLRQRKTLASI